MADRGQSRGGHWQLILDFNKNSCVGEKTGNLIYLIQLPGFMMNHFVSRHNKYLRPVGSLELIRLRDPGGYKCEILCVSVNKGPSPHLDVYRKKLPLYRNDTVQFKVIHKIRVRQSESGCSRHENEQFCAQRKRKKWHKSEKVILIQTRLWYLPCVYRQSWLSTGSWGNESRSISLPNTAY